MPRLINRVISSLSSCTAGWLGAGVADCGTEIGTAFVAGTVSLAGGIGCIGWFIADSPVTSAFNAAPATRSTFGRTSGANWAFGAASSLGSGVKSGAGAGVAAIAASAGSGVTSGAGAGVAATAASAGSTLAGISGAASALGSILGGSSRFAWAADWTLAGSSASAWAAGSISARISGAASAVGSILADIGPAQLVSYSMTSSARASTDGGIVRPSALAVLRLIASWYLVGVCTGRSAGFSPLRMRSTYSAARPYWSTRSGPYETKPPLVTKTGSE